MDTKKWVIWLTLAFVLGVLLFFVYQYYINSQEIGGNDNIAVNPQNQTDDTRDCVGDRVDQQLDEDFIAGKKFHNFCMSGEWGTFKEGGSLPVDWGLDYAGPDDDRSSFGEGEWKVADGKLVIAGTSISDGIYEDFRFYKYKTGIFAVPGNNYCGMFIGSNLDKIENFFDEKFDVESCK
ncbi:hypothetical protein ACFL1A_02350 [Patescibacteria group bacterium]